MLFEAHKSDFFTDAWAVQPAVRKHEAVESGEQVRWKCKSKNYISESVEHRTVVRSLCNGSRVSLGSVLIKTRVASSKFICVV